MIDYGFGDWVQAGVVDIMNNPVDCPVEVSSTACAIDIAEKYLNIGLKADILQYPISGWSMKYSQPLKENPQKRVTHEAVFHTITEVKEDGEY